MLINIIYLLFKAFNCGWKCLKWISPWRWINNNLPGWRGISGLGVELLVLRISCWENWSDQVRSIDPGGCWSQGSARNLLGGLNRWWHHCSNNLGLILLTQICFKGLFAADELVVDVVFLCFLVASPPWRETVAPPTGVSNAAELQRNVTRFLHFLTKLAENVWNSAAVQILMISGSLSWLYDLLIDLKENMSPCLSDWKDVKFHKIHLKLRCWRWFQWRFFSIPIQQGQTPASEEKGRV